MLLDQITKYSIGDTIYLITEKDKKCGIITCILIRPHDYIYGVQWNISTHSFHYEMELIPEYIEDLTL